MKADDAFATPHGVEIGKSRNHRLQLKRPAVHVELNRAQHLRGVGPLLLQRQSSVAIAIDLSDDFVRHRDARREVQLELDAIRLHREPRGLQVLIESMRRYVEAIDTNRPRDVRAATRRGERIDSVYKRHCETAMAQYPLNTLTVSEAWRTCDQFVEKRCASSDILRNVCNNTRVAAATCRQGEGSIRRRST